MLNPGALILELERLRAEYAAIQVNDNKFGRTFEVAGVLRGPFGAGLRVKTIWMTEHLSGVTKFVT
ncbi:MAG: hypothetical protein PSV13_21030 [Lacunisphaera sp.]|nr:hypothetical protein [Lacunisphaera sp.]